MRPEQAAGTRRQLTRYLISFDDGAMTFPDEDLPDVAEAAHAVAQEAYHAHLLLALFSPPPNTHTPASL